MSYDAVRTPTRVATTIVIALAFAASLAAVAPATSEGGASITLMPERAEVRDWVTVEGRDFAARERGDVLIDDVVVAAFRADREGGFVVRFRVPELQSGHYDVIADGEQHRASALLTVGDPEPVADDPDGNEDPDGTEDPDGSEDPIEEPGEPTPIEDDALNPLADATFFVDPDSNAAAEAERDPDNAHIWQRIADHSQADWFGDWNRDIEAEAGQRAAEIRSAGAVPVFVAYAIPLRDCGQYSAGGANSPEGYQDWIGGFAAGIEGHDVVVILEPDALAHLDCLDGEQATTRIQLIGEAIDTLNEVGASVYVDAGNSGWKTVEVIAERLVAAGVERARGFALNVSNFNLTQDEVAYGEAVSAAVGGAPFVVDTSRNGLGPSTDPRDSETWCNPPDRALGIPATSETGNELVDAYLWVKRPGESDGTCKAGPEAGQWYPEYAFGLAERAPWAVDDEEGSDGSDGSDDAHGDLTATITSGFSGGRNNDRHLQVTVTLEDGTGPIDGAEVVVSIEGGGSERSVTGTTGSGGAVGFSWNNAPAGHSFTITVLSVDGAPWTGEGGTHTALR